MTSTSSNKKWVLIGALVVVIGVAAAFQYRKYSAFLALAPKEDALIVGGPGDARESAAPKQVGREGSTFTAGDAKKIAGSAPIGKVTELVIAFQNGQLQAATAPGAKIAWNCVVHAGAADDFNPLEVDGAKARLALDKLRGMSCEIAVPSGVATTIQGTNGRVAVKKPSFPTHVTLISGQVAIEPDAARAYKFDVEAKNGRTDDFKSSTKKDAIEITASVVNGEVIKN